MANMFSGKREKQIPRSLYECTQPDATASNLHLWSERLERWGKFLFWFLIVWGVISAIAASIHTEIEFYGSYNQYTRERTTFDWDLFVLSLVETGLYAFLEYCAYHVLALLVSALALITQNSIVSANVALYEAMYQASKDNVDPDIPEPAATPAATAPVFRDQCPDFSKQVFKPAPDGMWGCKHCGTHNSLNYTQCKKCGKFKSE